jgi:hypothetical protein
MHGEGNSQALGASRWVHVLGAVRSREGRVMQVAPVVDVVGEQVLGTRLMQPKPIANKSPDSRSASPCLARGTHSTRDIRDPYD